MRLDMEKLLAQLQDDNVYGHISQDSTEHDKKTSCFNSFQVDERASTQV